MKRILGSQFQGFSRPVRALVMELVEGPTLAERIAAPGPRDAALDAAPGLRIDVGRVSRGGSDREHPEVGRVSRSRPAESTGLPLEETLSIAKQIAEALEDAW